jgi:hypothetical protein
MISFILSSGYTFPSLQWVDVIHKGDIRYVGGKSQRHSITIMETEKPPEEEMIPTTLDGFFLSYDQQRNIIFYAKLGYVPSTMNI